MDIFSRIAHFYDKIIPTFNIESIKPYVNFNSKKLILEHGGGTGRVEKRLLKIVNKCLIVDYSFKMLDEARERHMNYF